MTSPYQPRRLPLADEFWFLSHRDFGPGAYLGDGILGLGLAGALIGELALAGYVQLQSGRVIPGARPDAGGPAGFPRHAADSRRMPPPLTHRRIDPVHDEIMGHITARPVAYPVADWLAFLGGDAEQRVTDRMTAEGLVVQRGGLLRRTTWEPVDASTASGPAVTLQYHARMLVMHGELGAIDVQTALLAGLGLATNLAPKIDVDDRSNLGKALLEMAKLLDNDMLNVVAAVQESVTALTRQVRR